MAERLYELGPYRFRSCRVAGIPSLASQAAAKPTASVRYFAELQNRSQSTTATRMTGSRLRQRHDASAERRFKAWEGRGERGADEPICDNSPQTRPIRASRALGSDILNKMWTNNSTLRPKY
jgi:hypothetical protein